jgi:uncharacterized Zn finger protein
MNATSCPNCRSCEVRITKRYNKRAELASVFVECMACGRYDSINKGDEDREQRILEEWGKL